MDETPARAARIDAPLLNARLSKAQDADELLGLYVSGATRKPPNLDVNFENVELSSMGAARRAIGATRCADGRVGG